MPSSNASEGSKPTHLAFAARCRTIPIARAAITIVPNVDIFGFLLTGRKLPPEESFTCVVVLDHFPHCASDACREVGLNAEDRVSTLLQLHRVPRI